MSTLATPTAGAVPIVTQKEIQQAVKSGTLSQAQKIQASKDLGWSGKVDVIGSGGLEATKYYVGGKEVGKLYNLGGEEYAETKKGVKKATLTFEKPEETEEVSFTDEGATISTSEKQSIQEQRNNYNQFMGMDTIFLKPSEAEQLGINLNQTGEGGKEIDFTKDLLYAVPTGEDFETSDIVYSQRTNQPEYAPDGTILYGGGVVPVLEPSSAKEVLVKGGKGLGQTGLYLIDLGGTIGNVIMEDKNYKFGENLPSKKLTKIKKALNYDFETPPYLSEEVQATAKLDVAGLIAPELTLYGLGAMNIKNDLSPVIEETGRIISEGGEAISKLPTEKFTGKVISTTGKLINAIPTLIPENENDLLTYALFEKALTTKAIPRFIKTGGLLTLGGTQGYSALTEPDLTEQERYSKYLMSGLAIAGAVPEAVVLGRKGLYKLQGIEKAKVGEYGVEKVNLELGNPKEEIIMLKPSDYANELVKQNKLDFDINSPLKKEILGTFNEGYSFEQEIKGLPPIEVAPKIKVKKGYIKETTKYILKLFNDKTWNFESVKNSFLERNPNIKNISKENIAKEIAKFNFEKVVAHELIHYKTPSILFRIEDTLKIPYDYKPSELIAYRFQKSKAKKGFEFKREIGSNPVDIEFIPSQGESYANKLNLLDIIPYGKELTKQESIRLYSNIEKLSEPMSNKKRENILNDIAKITGNENVKTNPALLRGYGLTKEQQSILLSGKKLYFTHGGLGIIPEFKKTIELEKDFWATPSLEKSGEAFARKSRMGFNKDVEYARLIDLLNKENRNKIKLIPSTKNVIITEGKLGEKGWDIPKETWDTTEIEAKKSIKKGEKVKLNIIKKFNTILEGEPVKIAYVEEAKPERINKKFSKTLKDELDLKDYLNEKKAKTKEVNRERPTEKILRLPEPLIKERGKIRKANRELSRDITRDFDREIQRTVQRNIQRKSNRDITRNVPREIPREIPRDILRDITREAPRNVPREVPRIPIKEVPRETTIASLRGKSIKKKKSKQESYDVFIKVPKVKKYARVTKSPVGLKEAENLRNYLLDKSTSRTGFIKQSKKKPKPLPYSIPPTYEKDTSFKFRTYKVKKGSKIPLNERKVIERGKYILDEPEEVKQINVFKKLAQIEKRKIKKRGVVGLDFA
jgi:hypothetical protein